MCHEELPVRARYVSLLTSHRERNEELARDGGFTLVTDDPAAFFDKSKIDAVDVCTPNLFHKEQVDMALSRGFPVYCEKPLAIDPEDARELAEIASSAGLVNRVAFTYRFNRAALRAKAYVKSGIIGEIVSMRGHLFHSSYLDPQRPTSWRLQKRYSGGGALADLGIHVIDFMMYLAGPVTSVRAETKTFIAERPESRGASHLVPVDVDDWAEVDMEFQCGAHGLVETSRVFSGRDGSQVEVFGTKGSIVVDGDDPNNPVVHLFAEGTSTKGLPVRLPPWESEIVSLIPNPKMSLGGMVDSHMASLLRFCLSVARGELTYPDAPDFWAALRCQEVLEAAYLSAREGGRQVRLNGVKQFI